jgi:hypothetical protein
MISVLCSNFSSTQKKNENPVWAVSTEKLRPTAVDLCSGGTLFESLLRHWLS